MMKSRCFIIRWKRLQPVLSQCWQKENCIGPSVPPVQGAWYRMLLGTVLVDSSFGGSSWISEVLEVCQCVKLSCQWRGNSPSSRKCESLQFSSVTQSYPTLYNPMDCSMVGLSVYHQLPEFTQTHVHWVGDAIQPSHPLSSPSPPALNPSQHQGLFKWVSSSCQVAKVLEFQLQHQSLQWTFRTDLL